MVRCWLWVVRSDGQIEQHIGPFEPTLKVPDPQHPPRLMNVPDEKAVAVIDSLLSGYDQRSAHDVMLDVEKNLKRDKTGTLRRVAEAFVEIGFRVEKRQQRAQRGIQRAAWLAEIELADMTVRYRAE